jgi:hypothetical protein
MTQIPILNGIFTDGTPDFRTSYPVNLVPVPKSTGISEGYLRPADGIVKNGEGPGANRGGIEWRGVLYRVMGTRFVSIAADGAVTDIGDVGTGGRVSMAYGFDNLAINSGVSLYLYDGTTLAQVTDPDLLDVLDVIWIDGYFMTTDGEFIVVTELNDPFQVDPLKYGSSEVDPDPIKALVKLRNEVYALNRHTIEVFDNVGGAGFPFQRIDGAQIQKGTVGTHTCCEYMETVAFMGGGMNESISVYIGANGSAQKIATREVESILAKYTEAQLSLTFMQERTDRGHEFLEIHLPDETLVYDRAASEALQQPVWFILSSASIGTGQYLATDAVWCYDRWNVGKVNSADFGYLDRTIATHWGEVVGWEFGTIILYGEGMSAIINELELVALTGRVQVGKDPTVWTSYSLDGLSYSVEKPIKAGKIGQTDKRLVWYQQGMFRNWRLQKFRGNSDAQLSVARLQAKIEGLAF